MRAGNADGFAAVPRWLVRESDVSAHGRLVFLVLAAYADRERKCWPSIATIARGARCAKSTVRKALAELCAAGLIVIEKRPHGKVHDTNVYVLLDGGVVRDTDQGGPHHGRRWSVTRTRSRDIEVKGENAEVQPENATQIRLRRERDEWLAKHGLTLEEFEARQGDPSWLAQFKEAS